MNLPVSFWEAFLLTLQIGVLAMVLFAIEGFIQMIFIIKKSRTKKRKPKRVDLGEL